MFQTRVEKEKDSRPIVVGLYNGSERIGCAWETTVVDGLFNWSLHGTAFQGFGYSKDGYSLERACRDLTATAEENIQIAA